MPYIPHLLLSFRGTLGPSATPLETWSFGLRFGVPGVANPTLPGMTQGMVDEAHTAMNALIISGGMDFLSDVRTSFVKGYEIGADGNITAEPKQSGGVAVAGANTDDMPWQVAMAVTLFTGGLGKGRFGRVYMPPEAYSSANDGALVVAECNDRLAAMHTFLTSCAAVFTATPTVKLVVASQTGLLGTNREVTSIRVGRVMDTQRRRRRSLSEAYVTTAFGGS